MKQNKSIFIVFLLFILAFGGVLILQYNSYTATKSLIQTNENVLEEMDFSNNIQFFQTHIALLDKAIDEVIRHEGSIEDLERELKINRLTFNYIKTYLTYQNHQNLIEEIEPLIATKIDLGHQVLNEYNQKGNISNRLVDKILFNEKSNDLIDSKLIEIEEFNENKVKENTEYIDTSEENSHKSSLYFTVLSCILFGLAMYYIFRKIKSQHSLIQALHDSQSKEQKLNKIKEDFLANMSHEIRTPLNAIQGFTSILEKEPQSEKSIEITKTIRNASNQLMAIVNQILDLSKIEEGMIRIERAPFQLQKVIHSIKDSFRNSIEEKTLEFIIISEDNLAIEILGDEYRLVQILTNLISNAIKFTQKGWVRLEVVIHKIDENYSTIEFNVSDSGIGIAEDKLNTIFERFEQADNDTTRRYGGTGLGLAIVKQLVEIQNGNIKVKSKVNHGSSFTVTIPYELEDKNESNLMPSNTFKSNNIPIDAKILVVEDNPLNIKLLQHWFESRKLNFNHVENGKLAFERLKNESFEIILMDIQMPEMDGYQCAQMIRNELKLSTPIIGMTAHSMKHEILRCYESGMTAHISKPIDEDHFFQLIEDYSLINRSKLVQPKSLTLLSNGDPNFIPIFLKEFLIQTPLEIEKLKTAFYAENLSEIKSVAHSLKTNFSYLGMDHKLLKIIQTIENWKEIPSHYNQLFIVNYLYEKTKIEVENTIPKFSV